jgi:hypothetical protein
MGCAGSLARADFEPVALTPGSYSFDIVVESNAVQALPYCITATSGSGTSKGDNTYFEQGFYARPGQTGWNYGIPRHHTVFTNLNNSAVTFLMPPDYTTNNDLQIDSTTTSGTLYFNTPTSATNLAILSGGGGSGSMGYTVNHTDGSTESGTLSIADWFTPNGAQVAWGANARVSASGGYDVRSTSSANTTYPYLYSYYLTVSDATPIASITFTYSSVNEGNFYAVSGEEVGASLWTPIPVGGFNQITTVPAGFPLTATMDQGANTANNGNLATWFEQGYVRDTATDATYGLPPSGSTFASQSQPTHYFQMGNYSSNNAILVDASHKLANITPAAPAPFAAFSLLTAGGNVGGSQVMTNLCILQHADGVNETNLFYGYDWFNSSISPAYVANGRVNMYSRTVNNLGSGNPKLFESYFVLNDVRSPVTNILVEYQTSPGANSTTYILAVSAAAGGVPPVVTGATPADQTWYPTESATFSVAVSGTPTITNAWYIQQGVDVNSNPVYVPLTDGLDANGSTIVGSGTTNLSIKGLTVADGTNYVEISANAWGATTSSPALLVINTATPEPPIIDSQSPTADVTAFTNHNTLTAFSVTIDATSSLPLHYQWYNGTSRIPGANSSSYQNVDSNSASIFCVITNFFGSVTSSPVAVTVYPQPNLSPYQETVFAYHPLAYWPLNETSGSIAYDLASTNDGTYEGGYTLGESGLPAWTGVDSTNSAGFDGSSGYVAVPVNNLNLTGAITLIQWIQTPVGGDSGFRTTLGHSDSSYRLDLADGQPHFADSGPDIVSSLVINDGQWHQLVGVFDGTNQFLYVDGALAAGPYPSTPSGADYYDVIIGGAPDYSDRYFEGNIAEVAILPVALTAVEVKTVYDTIESAPIVTISPASPSVYAGTSILLTAGTSGTPASSFQWYYIDTVGNSNVIAKATNSTYTIANTSLDQNGYTYGIIAENEYGTTVAAVTLTVQNGPAFLVGDIFPLTGEAYAGAPVTYMVVAQGSLPIYYQWLVDGSPVSGATNASYTLALPSGSHTIQATFTNAQSGGTPVTSSTAALQVDADPTAITFNDNGTGWQFNSDGNGSVPTLSSGVLELTDGTGGEASSAFYAVAQYVGAFTASFTYTGNGEADGVAFVIEDAASTTNALGDAGGGLGCKGVTNSLAFEIDLYTNPNSGVDLNTNGNIGPFAVSTPVSIDSGDPIDVTLNWANGALSVMLVDTTTSTSFTTNFTAGAPSVFLGGTDLGYIGFTGGDGSLTSVQTISNFSFMPVIVPVALSSSLGNAGSLIISWPAADPNYVLEVTPSLDPATWTTGPTPVTINGVNQVMVDTAGTQAQFYRLVRIVRQ